MADNTSDKDVPIVYKTKSHNSTPILSSTKPNLSSPQKTGIKSPPIKPQYFLPHTFSLSLDEGEEEEECDMDAIWQFRC